MDALQAVHAAGQPAGAVGELRQQQAEAEREHDQGEMPEAADDETRGIADDARRRAGDDEPGQWLAPAIFRQQAGGVGADAEEGGVPQRDDAGIAEDQIQRQCEQRRRWRSGSRATDNPGTASTAAASPARTRSRPAAIASVRCR